MQAESVRTPRSGCTVAPSMGYTGYEVGRQAKQGRMIHHARGHQEIQEGSRDHNRRKHTHQDPYQQCRRKSSDATRAKVVAKDVKHCADQHRTGIGVANGGPCAFPPQFDGCSK